ncbi:TPA: hypothetical protein LAP77_003061 [Escherichia coli]|nr:hypothetical protein [Escherichia coli]
MSIWLTGVVSYELTGVKLMLSEYPVKVQTVTSDTQFTPGDTLILCLGSTPLIGWWRYLRLIQWFDKTFGLNLIVLCPEKVCSMNLFCGGKVAFLSMNSFSASVPEVLLCARKKEPEIRNTDRFWFYAFMCLREEPSVEVKGSSKRRAYYRRQFLLRKLNLSSIHLLRIFMSGINVIINQ